MDMALQSKGDWWDATLFVSPLHDGCERQFQFTWGGRIRPFPEASPAPEETIAHLGLDCDTLKLLRKSAIDYFFGFVGGAPITRAQARRLFDEIDRPGTDGKLRAFCFVLKQLLGKYMASSLTTR